VRGRPTHHSHSSGSRLALLGLAAALAGCASPGPPRPPSLQLPQPVHNLTAARQGDEVLLQFTLPQRTTDSLPIRSGQVAVTLCRGPEPATCLPLPGFTAQRLSVTEASGLPRSVSWHDRLPANLTTGDPRSLVYRIELSNPAARSAGWSAPAYTAAGTAPPVVDGFTAEGTRKGILLRWQPTPSSPNNPPPEVLLRRDLIGAPAAPPVRHTVGAPARLPASHAEPPTTLWLTANATPAANPTPAATTLIAETLDTSAVQDVPYRYTAVRRRLIQLGGRSVELRSAPSAPVEFTLRDIFPPAVPTGLSAAPFTQSGQFAVDLVWGPVDDPGLAGYNISRQTLDPNGAPQAAPTRLNTTPVTLPAFHDATASPTARLRYSITAIDNKGNESTAATVTVEPSTR
jgi:hypothetical protein